MEMYGRADHAHYLEGGPVPSTLWPFRSWRRCNRGLLFGAPLDLLGAGRADRQCCLARHVPTNGSTLDGQRMNTYDNNKKIMHFSGRCVEETTRTHQWVFSLPICPHHTSVDALLLERTFVSYAKCLYVRNKMEGLFYSIPIHPPLWVLWVSSPNVLVTAYNFYFLCFGGNRCVRHSTQCSVLHVRITYYA